MTSPQITQSPPASTGAARPRGSHRIEFFSPKLSRRLVLFSRQAFELWLLLEVDPQVIQFVERPRSSATTPPPQSIDFWVQYRDKETYVTVGDDLANATWASEHHLPFRLMPPAELAANRTWIGNWEQMLPAIIACRDNISNDLLSAIERHVDSSMPMSRIERHFSNGDPIVVRAALFFLVYAGRLACPDLRLKPLSFQTCFEPLKRVS